MKKLLSMIFVVNCVATSMNFALCGKKERRLREQLGGIGGDLPEGISRRSNNSRERDRNYKGAYRKYRQQCLE